MNRHLWRAWHLTLTMWLLLVSTSQAQIKIVLQNDFIEAYKQRVTIDTEYTVDKAHKRPNPPSKDGDMHIAGRANEVKLPIVAEIMNAKDDAAAVATIHSAEGTGNSVQLGGAWRLWCEHGGQSEQIQGAPLEPITTTNPDHVFEIHPITKLEGRSLLPTLKPIEGFQTKDAHEAFQAYEGLRCQIVPGSEATTLLTTMGGYNYVEFVMEINSAPLEVEDGLIVMAKIRDLQGELLVRNRRVVMVKDSDLEQKTRGKPVGTQIHVLGLPRIDLALVSWRTKAAAAGKTDVLTWGLPYEIIGIGFYNYVENEDQPHVMRALEPLPRRGRLIPKTLTPPELERVRSRTTSPPHPSEINR